MNRIKLARYLVTALALAAAVQTYAACFKMGVVVCHVGGPATRTIPSLYPCAGRTVAGTDDTMGTLSAIGASAGDTGRTGIKSATAGNYCIWGFAYPCYNQTETAYFTSPLTRFVLDENATICHP